MDRSSVTNAKLAAKGIGIGSIVTVGGLAMNIVSPIMTYNIARKEGKSSAVAAGQAIGEFALWNIAAPIMWGSVAFQAGQAVYEAGNIIGQQNKQYLSNAFKNQFGGNYIDSHNAANMRRAGGYNIEYSKQNVQQTLGGEAKGYARQRSYYRRDTYVPGSI